MSNLIIDQKSPVVNQINLTHSAADLGRLFKALPAPLAADQRSRFGAAVDRLAGELGVGLDALVATVEYRALVEDWCSTIAEYLTLSETADARFAAEGSK